MDGQRLWGYVAVDGVLMRGVYIHIAFAIRQWCGMKFNVFYVYRS